LSFFGKLAEAFQIFLGIMFDNLKLGCRRNWMVMLASNTRSALAQAYCLTERHLRTDPDRARGSTSGCNNQATASITR
jgi:hypothetical protein